MLFSKRMLIACSLGLVLTSSSARAEDWKDVVAAAKKEGKVVIYCMALGAPYYAAVLKSFEAKYGITVESLDLRASELAERVRTEQSAGRYTGDTELITTTMIEAQQKSGDYIQKLGDVPMRQFAAAVQEDGFHAAGLRPAHGHPDQHADGFPGGRTQELGRPQQSEMDREDPLRRYAAARQRQRDVFGAAEQDGSCFQREAGEQKPVFSRDMRNDARRVARGEYPIYIPQVFAFASDLKGLPIKVVIPKEGAPYASFEFALLKNAPHPNAARLLINHFLEVDLQLLYANAWMLPVVNGVVEKANDDAKPFANAKLMGQATLEERPAMMELAKKLYQ